MPQYFIYAEQVGDALQCVPGDGPCFTILPVGVGGGRRQTQQGHGFGAGELPAGSEAEKSF